MTRLIACLTIVFLHNFVYAQTNYTDSIAYYRKKYKADFLTDDHSPLQKKDLRYLDFYAPAIAYRVDAKFSKLNDSIGFDILTHSKKIKRYYKYGKCEFTLKDTICVLYIYQSIDLMQKPDLQDYLFIPFNDLTNYITTYAGGRYLDFRISDIINNRLVIDFNKAYNPYCMYAEGYSCPIPPDENKLNIAIEAGEKLFKKTK